MCKNIYNLIKINTFRFNVTLPLSFQQYKGKHYFPYMQGN